MVTPPTPARRITTATSSLISRRIVFIFPQSSHTSIKLSSGASEPML
jgi:hypothetical protein